MYPLQVAGTLGASSRPKKIAGEGSGMFRDQAEVPWWFHSPKGNISPRTDFCRIKARVPSRSENTHSHKTAGPSRSENTHSQPQTSQSWGSVTARIRAARPSHYLWPPGCSGRERGVRRTAMKAVLVTDPEMGLSSGCFVGLELIEGES